MKPRILRAQALEIVDQTGAVRMVMGVDDGCPMIEMFDARGVLKATMYVGKNGDPGLAFGHGTKQVNLLLYLDGEGCPQIRMLQPDLQNHVVLSCVPAPSLTLNDGIKELVISPSEEGAVRL